MSKILKKEKATQFGLYCTFHIIPRSLKPYKLMKIYAINPEKNNTLLSCLICIKFIPIFNKNIFNFKSCYNFEPKLVNTGYDTNQIKALKNCDLFIKKPFVICCFFHYVQSIIKNFKKYNIIKKNEETCIWNVKKYKKNIENYFKFLKDHLILNDKDKLFFNYYENYWIKKNKNYFNYSELTKDIIKIINKYINEKGNINIEKNLLSELKGLKKLYFTKNICETVHSYIANNLFNNKVTKKNFRDTVNNIIEKYKIKNENIIIKDFICRTLIIFMLIMKLNEKPKIINYDEFKTELQKSVFI